MHSNIGALIIRIGLWGISYYNYFGPHRTRARGHCDIISLDCDKQRKDGEPKLADTTKEDQHRCLNN